ncbi:MAG: hypothetical protein AABO41_21645 [Acidobacteriota bacterium]
MKSKLFLATFTVCMLFAGGAVSRAAMVMQAPTTDQQTGDQSIAKTKGTNKTKKESNLKKAALDVGKGTQATGKEVGKGGEKAGKAVAKGSEKVAKGTAVATKDAGKVTAKGAEKTGKATARGVKKVGSEFKKIGK